MPPPRLWSRCPRLASQLSRQPHGDAGVRSFRPPMPSIGRAQPSRRFVDRVNQRYGTANEPPPHLGGATTPDQTAAPTPASSEKELPPPAESKADSQAQQLPEPASEQQSRDAQDTEPAAERVTTPSSPAPPSPAETKAEEKAPSIPPSATDASAALGSILSMQPPMADAASESHPPHLQTPPYIHYFDTYSFISSLQTDQAFSDKQSVTVMKAIRALLADNMDLAREGIVSRGDAEMDAYQFRAASGELRTEMRQRRAAADERYRAERMQLQHEVDTLGARITQESLTLRDELKGMFDDRKMAVRVERRSTDNRIQELGYKITTAMNSGMRNEIEGLRFILTRRTVLALTAVVVMSLMALRLATYSSKKEEQQQQQHHRDQHKENPREEGGGGGGGGGDMSSEDIARGVQRGTNPALASLV